MGKSVVALVFTFTQFLIVNGKPASGLKRKKKESLNSFAIHVLYVKYQRVSMSDKVGGGNEPHFKVANEAVRTER